MSKNQKLILGPVLAMILAHIVWGTNIPFLKLGLQSWPPVMLSFIKIFGSAILLYLFTRKKIQRLDLRDNLLLITSSFAGVTAAMWCLYIGLEHTTSISAAIIELCGPILLYFTSIKLLRESFKPRVLIGILLALAGVLLIVLMPILKNGEKIDGSLFGNICVLGYVIFNIIGVLVAKPALKRVNPQTVTFIRLFWGGLPLGLIALSELHGFSLASVSASGWVAVVQGIIGVALANILFYIGLKGIDAEDVGLFSYIEPIVVVLIAIPLLGEHLNSLFLIGGLLVFAGIYFAEAHKHKIRIHLHGHR